MIRLPPELTGVDYGFVFLSSLLHAHVGELFEGMNVLGCYQFRVTRNSDMFVDEEEVKDLRATLKGELQQRHYLATPFASNWPTTARKPWPGFLMKQFGLVRPTSIASPAWSTRSAPTRCRTGRPPRSQISLLPADPPERPRQTREHLCRDPPAGHSAPPPFQSFEPVIELLKAAADDPERGRREDDGLSHRHRLRPDGTSHPRRPKGQRKSPSPSN